MNLPPHLSGFLAIATICVTLGNLSAHGSQLVFSDDFNTVNPAWQFALTDTQNNATAISASYGKIENGALQLKANVGSGWDFLYSWATLNLPLPTDYEMEYRMRKLQWSGALWTIVAGTTVEDLEPYPSFHFAEAGNIAYGLDIALAPGNYISAPAVNAGFNNGPWYDFKIVKNGEHLETFVNGVLQHTADGVPFDGGFLKFAAVQAGATVEIDNVMVYDIIPEPGSCLLLGFGLTLIALRRRR